MTHGTDDLEQYAELAALADGTLSGRRRDELEEEVAGSPTLQALLAEQQQAVDLFRGMELAAPRELRDRLVPRREPRRRPRLSWPQSLAGGAALAALVAVVVLVVGGT